MGSTTVVVKFTLAGVDRRVSVARLSNPPQSESGMRILHCPQVRVLSKTKSLAKGTRKVDSMVRGKLDTRYKTPDALYQSGTMILDIGAGR